DPDHADTHLGTDRPVVEPVQHLHDLRLVRTSAHAEQQALDHRSAGQLGHRPVRIHADGAGQPHRLYRAVGGAAEDNAGSDHPVRVRALCGALHASTPEAGLSLGRALSARRGVFYFPGLSLAIRLEVSHRPPPGFCTSARNWATRAVTGSWAPLLRASSSTMARSLRIQSTAKPKSTSPASMVLWRLSSCQDWAAPLLITAMAASPSSPAHWAKCSASARPWTRPAMQIWFTILVSCPLPTGPISLTMRA